MQLILCRALGIQSAKLHALFDETAADVEMV
jgi:hypothetical protein